MSELILTNIATPLPPSAGKVLLYAKGDSFCIMGDDGIEYYLTQNLTLVSSTAADDFIVGDGSQWNKKTLAETKTILGGREVLSAARTYYVREDGSDSNDGLADTSGGAFLTIQRAIDVLCNTIDTGGQDVTIQVGTGTYAEDISIATPWSGGGSLLIQGDTGTPDNVIVTGITNFICTANLPAPLTIQGFRLIATNVNISMVAPGVLHYGAINFEGLYNLSSGAPGSYIICDSDYTISDSGTNHISLNRGAALIISGKTVTLSGTPEFTTFANIQMCGVLRLATVTFSGSASAATQKYSATTNGVILTSGGVTLPGGVAGSTATGGQYV